MIKLRMHETTLEGKPLPDTGRVISGEDAYEVVEAMKLQSPFTAEMTQREYIDNILSKIMPSKEAAELDATEFLTKLAERGFLSFLPEDGPYPPHLIEVIGKIARSGATNMLDVPVVAGIALKMGKAEIAEWINAHRNEYTEIILYGRPEGEATEEKSCADSAE